MDQMEYRPTNHPYYCEMSNYNSTDEPESYATWDDFLQEYKDADKDYNFIFRFDILESEQFFNRHMVDHADVLLAVYDNDRSIRSETGMTVNYARKKGLSIILIHPDTGAVTMV